MTLKQSRPAPESFAVGVDVGATKIAAALVAADGSVQQAHQLPTDPERGWQAVLDDVAALVATLSVAAPAAPPARLLGVGVGTPGRVDALAGVVRNAVNLAWDEVPLVAELGTRLAIDLPVFVQKDANASALGEYYFGAAQGSDDFVYLSIGSGLGGGVMAGGILVTGADWNAAELGHLSLDPAGLLCACGNRGCAETVVSGPGLLQLAQTYLAEQCYDTNLPPADHLDPETILAAAGDGDELALAALNEVGRHLGMVMAACVALLNPGRIVIGGGLGLAAFDFLLPPARQALRERTLAGSIHHLQILPSRVESSAVGAASLVWHFGHDEHSKGGEKLQQINRLTHE